MRSAPLLLALALAAGCQRAPAGPPIHLEPMTLEAFQKRLADDRASGKVAVAHFWATWCGPCLEEFPQLAHLERQLQGEKDLDFFGVAVEEKSPADVAKFAAENGAAFPLFLADAPDSQVFIEGVKKDWAGELPSTFGWNRQGVLVLDQRGPIEDFSQFQAKLKALAAR